MYKGCIALTTDFGLSDPYVGVMKGVIAGINPDAHVIDISHQVQPQNILHGSMLLATSYSYFPHGTIHLAVVDPGVGTDRAPVIVVTPEAYFVGPDNGLVSGILQKYMSQVEVKNGQISVPEQCMALKITTSDLFLKPLSKTFHGRDIFAPIAAYISLGTAVDSLGTRVEKLVSNAIYPATHADGRIIGSVVYIDHFGNLITNIENVMLEAFSDVTVQIADNVALLKDTFNETGFPQQNDMIALPGSNGYLEIALPNGNASLTFKISAGAEVTVFGHVSE
ncbi:MAG: SAM-dependent chlorinase/fluorinase [Chloroflexota bacterium]|nr:SAM-dependent chlorinase/fluorinase [Chloroflexota bacterium]